MNRFRIGVLLAALGLSAATGWFFEHFDRVTESVYVGLRGAAQRNPYLAAQRLAERLGADALEVRTLPALAMLPEGGLLVLPAARGALDGAMLDAILAWVEEGGRVLAEPESPGVRDALGARLGIAHEAFEARSARSREKVCVPTGESLLDIPGHDRMLAADLPHRSALRLPEEGLLWKVESRVGPQIAALAHGEGEVVFVTSLEFLRNRQIGQHDHAELAWLLLGEGEHPAIHFFNQPRKLSLLDWLQLNAAPAIAGFVLLVILWLWRIAPRFGPLVPDVPPERRRLLEHLRAAGRYAWSTDRARELFMAAREACLARVLHTHPDIAAGGNSEGALRIGNAYALPPVEVERALYAANPPRDEHHFIRSISTMQALHACLARAPGEPTRRRR